jgi:RNA polymerase sigma-70 factor (ECF subfamily)
MSLFQTPAEAGRSFATTQWSLVLRAGQQAEPAAADALATLCERYWSPVYVYVRRRSRDEHAARDTTQGFFAHLLEHNGVAHASPERGRFRSFLLTAVKHYLVNAMEREQAQKRGGGKQVLSLDWEAGESRWRLLEPAHATTAERLFEREWALQLLQGVMQQLRAEFTVDGKAAQFEVLRQTLAGGSDRPSYDRIGQELGLFAEAARQAAHRLRKRYREVLREHVAATLAADEDVEAEIGRLIEILGEST